MWYMMRGGGFKGLGNSSQHACGWCWGEFPRELSSLQHYHRWWWSARKTNLRLPYTSHFTISRLKNINSPWVELTPHHPGLTFNLMYLHVNRLSVWLFTYITSSALPSVWFTTVSRWRITSGFHPVRLQAFDGDLISTQGPSIYKAARCSVQTKGKTVLVKYLVSCICQMITFVQWDIFWGTEEAHKAGITKCR